MANNYAVVLDKYPTRGTYTSDYFPRGFHYKQDADRLVELLEASNGKAHVVPKSQFSPELIRKFSGK